MRKQFSQSAKILLTLILDKLKDKKTNVIEDSQLTLEQFYNSLELFEIIEDVKECLNQKAPNLKCQIMIWVNKCLDSKKTKIRQEKLAVEGFKSLVPCLKKLLDDSDVNVRNGAIQTFGKMKGKKQQQNETLQLNLGCFGNFLSSQYDGIDEKKMAKINEIATKIDPQSEKKEQESVVSSLQSTMVSQQPKKSSNIEIKENSTLSKLALGQSVLQKTDKIDKTEKSKNDDKKIQSQNFSSNFLNIDECEMQIKQADINPKFIKAFDVKFIITNIKFHLIINGYYQDSKWKEKNDALQDLLSEQLELAVSIFEYLITYLKYKTKEWKESNLQINKSLFELIMKIQNNDNKPMTKKCFYVLSYFLTEKMSDIKFQPQIKEIIEKSCETVPPKYIIQSFLEQFSDTKKTYPPKILTELLNYCGLVLNLTGAHNIPLMEMISFSKTQLQNTNTGVKQASQSLLKQLYSHLGSQLNNFLNDIPQQTLKSLQMELDKVKLLSMEEKQCKIQFVNEAEAEAVQQDGANPMDQIARADISKDVEKILKKVGDKDVKVKKEGLDALENILIAKSNRIKITGLQDLISLLKQRLNDANKAIQRGYIQFVGKFAEAVGKDIKTHCKVLLQALVPSLADKNSLNRGDALDTINKFSLQIGASLVIQIIAPFLSENSPDLKLLILQWILNNHEGLNEQCDIKSFINPLLMCILDKNKDLRNVAEELFEKCLPVFGHAVFISTAKDLKPALLQQITPIYQKYNCEMNGDKKVLTKIVSTKNLTQEIKPINQVKVISVDDKSFRATPKKSVKPPIGKLQLSGQKVGSSKKQLDSPRNKVMDSSIDKKDEQSFNVGIIKAPQNILQNETSLNSSYMSNNSIVQDIQGLISTIENDCQIVSFSISRDLKNFRIIDQQQNPWPHDELNDDLINQLQNNLTQLLQPLLVKQLFSMDAKKHIEGANILLKCCFQEPENIQYISDLVIKWCFMRIFANSNKNVIVVMLKLLFELINCISNLGSSLFEFESQLILGSIINTFDIIIKQDDEIRQQFYQIIQKINEFFPFPKISKFFSETLLITQSEKQRTEILMIFDKYLVPYCQKELQILSRIDQIYQFTNLIKNLEQQHGHQNLLALGFKLNFQKNELEQSQPSQGLTSFHKQRSIMKTQEESKNTKSDKFNQLNNQSFNKNLNRSSNQSFQNVELENSHNESFEQQNKSYSDYYNSDHNNSNEKLKSTQQIDAINQSEQIQINQQIDQQKNIQNLQQLNQLNSLQKQNFLKQQQSNQLQQQLPQNQQQKQIQDNISIQYEQQQQIIFDNQKQFQNQQQQIIQDNINQQQQQLSHQNEQSQNYQQYENEEQNLQMQKIQQNNHYQNQLFDLNQNTMKPIPAHIFLHQLNILQSGDIKQREEILSLILKMHQYKIQENQQSFIIFADQLGFALQEAFQYFLDVRTQIQPEQMQFLLQQLAQILNIQEFVQAISLQIVYSFSNLIMVKLLEEDQNKGTQVAYVSQINTMMVKLLDYAHPSLMFETLFELLINNWHQYAKKNSLIVKCIIKVIRNLKNTYQNIDIRKLFVKFHQYMQLDPNHSGEDLGVKAIKTILNELIIIVGLNIWEYYIILEQNNMQDFQLKSWINTFLQAQNLTINQNSQNYNHQQDPRNQLYQIVQYLKDGTDMNQNIPLLAQLLEKFPDVDINQHLTGMNLRLRDYILSQLDQQKQIRQQSRLNEIKRKNFQQNSNNQYGSQSNLNYDVMSSKFSQIKQKFGIQNDQTSNQQINEYSSKLSKLSASYSSGNIHQNQKNDKIVEQYQPIQQQRNLIPPSLAQQSQPQNYQTPSETYNTVQSSQKSNTQSTNELRKKLDEMKMKFKNVMPDKY